MREKLKKILEKNQGNITEEVIKEALEYHNPKAFFEDLLQYGCQSGIIGSLIRYKDTHEFFEKHYDEIQEITNELQKQGIELKIPTDTDLKNFLAWLGFEERTRNLYHDLEIER